MKILFVHPPVGNALELFRAFNRNPECEIQFLSKYPGKSYSLLDRIRHRLGIPGDMYDYNRLLNRTDLSTFDTIFIVKGNTIYPSTLRKITQRYPNVKLISWSQDDMYARHNRSIYYTRGLRYYDLVFTTKSFNTVELKALGAKRVVFHNKAYSSDIHRPLPNSASEFAHDVIFVGSLERERFESMCFLADHGIEVHVYSDQWNKKAFKQHPENLIIHQGGLYGDQYAEAISNSKITLCFLRKINRDLQTSRSIEIPACGGCMVAERTEEHLALFKEGIEAVYFSGNQELLEKVTQLLGQPERREKIARNGLARCKSSGYSYDDLVEELIPAMRFAEAIESNPKR